MKKNGFEVHDLSFSFKPDSPLFFDALSASFDAGHVYTITGANGIGKSTLFQLLQANVFGAQQLNAEFVIDGKIYKIGDSFKNISLSDIKAVQQNVSCMLAQNFTVKEHLQLALLGQYPSMKALPFFEDENILKLFNEVGIKLGQRVRELSGGQRQILAIIMVLQKPTKVLLLDEPTASLDRKNAELIFQILRSLTKEHDFVSIVITHDQELLALQEPHLQFSLVMQNGLRKLISKVLS